MTSVCRTQHRLRKQRIPYVPSLTLSFNAVGRWGYPLDRGLATEDEKWRALTSVRPGHQHGSGAIFVIAAYFDINPFQPERDGAQQLLVG